MAHSGTPLYNGNIAETEWRTANTDSGLKWYRYAYDPLNRITSATANSSNYSLSGITYDKNGNLLSLTRRGHTNAGATSFGNMDILDYDYHNSEMSNRLYKVNDTGSDTYGFKDSSANNRDYWYDANGNMVRDLNKGIGTASVDGISYNHLNIPTSVVINNAQHNGTISYIYDATGVKLKKTVGSTTTEYAGNYIYENNALQFFGHPEGYVMPNTSGAYDYVYQYRDHLGNVRLSYTDNNGTLEIIEENNYYPFGLQHKGYNSVVNGTENNYMTYNGKELNESLGLNVIEMDFRQYDPAIGRFMSIDPLTEERERLTPYNFVQNNPLIRIDPSGLLDDFHIYSDGSIVRQKTDDATDTFIFHDSNGNQHDIATLEKNENGLINAPNIDYDSGDGTSVSVSSKPGNESEINISGTALAAVVGASADSGEEIFITRASNADGSSPGDSKTHTNGNNIDIRFAGQNGGRNPIDFETSVNSFNQIDQDASSRMNASLKKFGYKSINASNLSVPMSGGDSSNPTFVTGTVMGTRHLGNHFDHQHLQRFRPNVTIRNKAVPVPTITKGVKL